MMNGFQGLGWMKEKSDSGNTISDFLEFVYTRDEDDEDYLDRNRTRPVSLRVYRSKLLSFASRCYRVGMAL